MLRNSALRRREIFLTYLSNLAARGKPRTIDWTLLAFALDHLTRRGGLEDLARQMGFTVPDLLATFKQYGYTPHTLFEAYVEYPEVLAREALKGARREQHGAVPEIQR